LIDGFESEDRTSVELKLGFSLIPHERINEVEIGKSENGKDWFAWSTNVKKRKDFGGLLPEGKG